MAFRIVQILQPQPSCFEQSRQIVTRGARGRTGDSLCLEVCLERSLNSVAGHVGGSDRFFTLG